MKTLALRLLHAFVLLTALPAAAADFASGERVLGRWGDGHWYPATVDRRVGDELELRFDDGDVARLGPVQVRAIDWREGTRLQCNWKNQGRYFPAILTGREGEHIEIAYDDGDHESATLARCRAPGNATDLQPERGGQPAR